MQNVGINTDKDLKVVGNSETDKIDKMFENANKQAMLNANTSRNSPSSNGNKVPYKMKNITLHGTLGKLNLLNWDQVDMHLSPNKL